MKFNITESSVVDYNQSPRNGLLSPIGKSLHIERIFLEEEKAIEIDRQMFIKSQKALEKNGTAITQDDDFDFIIDFKDKYDDDSSFDSDEKKQSHN